MHCSKLRKFEFTNIIETMYNFQNNWLNTNVNFGHLIWLTVSKTFSQWLKHVYCFKISTFYPNKYQSEYYYLATIQMVKDRQWNGRLINSLIQFIGGTQTMWILVNWRQTYRNESQRIDDNFILFIQSLNRIDIR